MDEKLQVVEIIEFKTFKEKIDITKEYDRKAKMEIIDNKYVYVKMRMEGKVNVRKRKK